MKARLGGRQGSRGRQEEKGEERERKEGRRKYREGGKRGQLEGSEGKREEKGEGQMEIRRSERDVVIMRESNYEAEKDTEKRRRGGDRKG